MNNKLQKKIATSVISFILALALIGGSIEVVEILGGPSLTLQALGSDGGGGSSVVYSTRRKTKKKKKVVKKKLKIKAKSAVSLSGDTLTKKKLTIKRSRLIKLNNAGGTVRYSIVKVKNKKNKKFISINKKTGKVTVKKGANPGTYKVTIQVKTKGNSKCRAGKKKATVKIKISKRSMAVTGKKVTLDGVVLQDENITVSRSEIMSLSNAGGTVTYSMASVKDSSFTDYFSVGEQNGELTASQGLPPGTYTVRILVNTTGDSKCKPGKKVVSVTVAVSEPPEIQDEPNDSVNKTASFDDTRETDLNADIVPEN